MHDLRTIARPADRLPEPYRSELLSFISSYDLDGTPFSLEGEERAVQDMEHRLANGERERRRQQVERQDEERKNFPLALPIIKARNPLPRW